METELNQLEEQGSKYANLHKITPLSKYLAMLPFVILPFVGGYIGYMYAPEKVVEVARTVAQEENKNQQYGHDSEDTWSASNSFSQVTSVFEDQRIAMEIGDYSDGVLLFTIGSQRLVNDHRLFIDFLHFDEVTGMVTLRKYKNEDSVDKLMQLHKLSGNVDLETLIEDVVIDGNESELDAYILAGLQLDQKAAQQDDFTFRSFCELYINEYPDEYPNRKIAYLTYDKDIYGEEYDLKFGPAGPCGRNNFIIFDDLIVRSFSAPIDATEPKIINSTVNIDHNLSYVSRTGETVYKYNFLGSQ